MKRELQELIDAINSRVLELVTSKLTALTRERGYHPLPSDVKHFLPLHAAVQVDSVKILKELLRYSTYPHLYATNENGFTPIMLAASKKQWDCVGAFAEYMVYGKDECNFGSALLDVVTHKQYPLAVVLLQGGTLIDGWCDIHAHDSTLHWAVKNNNPYLVSLLVEYKANKNAKNKAQQTPEQLAQALGYDLCVDALECPSKKWRAATYFEAIMRDEEPDDSCVDQRQVIAYASSVASNKLITASGMLKQRIERAQKSQKTLPASVTRLSTKLDQLARKAIGAECTKNFEITTRSAFTKIWSNFFDVMNSQVNPTPARVLKVYNALMAAVDKLKIGIEDLQNFTPEASILTGVSAEEDASYLKLLMQDIIKLLASRTYHVDGHYESVVDFYAGAHRVYIECHVTFANAKQVFDRLKSQTGSDYTSYGYEFDENFAILRDAYTDLKQQYPVSVDEEELNEPLSSTATILKVTVRSFETLTPPVEEEKSSVLASAANQDVELSTAAIMAQDDLELLPCRTRPVSARRSP